MDAECPNAEPSTLLGCKHTLSTRLQLIHVSNISKLIRHVVSSIYSSNQPSSSLIHPWIRQFNSKCTFQPVSIPYPSISSHSSVQPFNNSSTNPCTIQCPSIQHPLIQWCVPQCTFVRLSELRSRHLFILLPFIHALLHGCIYPFTLTPSICDPHVLVPFTYRVSMAFGSIFSDSGNLAPQMYYLRDWVGFDST